MLVFFSTAHGADGLLQIRMGPVLTGADLLNWGLKRPLLSCRSTVDDKGIRSDKLVW